MEYRYQHGTEVHTVLITERPEGYEVCVGERRYLVRAREVNNCLLDFWVDGRFRQAHHAEQDNERWLNLYGNVYHATRVRHRRKEHHAGESTNTLAATMPGQIISVLVSEGDEVERGQLLALMEAMKMELRVTAPHDGTVARVLVTEGEAVERGQTLIML